MAVVYLSLIALLTAATLVLAAAWAPFGPGPGWRLAVLVGLWALVVGAVWPISRLTFDMAFILGSQATAAVAMLLGLAPAWRRRAARRHRGPRVLQEDA